ncbi:tRNA-specific adenosine deaminase 1 [Cryptococcus neoformans Gb118]|nr:tRNA-specific adenosine deaminase 1 [Cryptococcus neoformans var. grubii MW-RSA36]OXL07285.1 tRNA-specific adenosine deaminase 1 [Cryptococcus neoformans var. grubii Gb118]
MTPLSDRIAQSSISLYETLPKHGKPNVRDNGVPEWTILSVISLVVRQPPTFDSDHSDVIVPVSLGTGVKVLPHHRLPPLGDAVHDCHGEIIARRGFIRWLIFQAALLDQKENGRIGEGSHALYVERGENGKLKLKDGVDVWLYVSALPCGDASTLYTAMHQPPEEASQWTEPPPIPHDSPAPSPTPLFVSSHPLRGRNTYATMSTLRTKPGRPDSPPTTSMSCSDKIATWVCVGLQGGLLADLYEKVKLEGLVIGGVEQPPGWVDAKDVWEDKIEAEAARALYWRLETIRSMLPKEYPLHKPQLHFTSTPFSHSKPSISSTYPTSPEPQPSPLSLSFLPWLFVPDSKPGRPPKQSEREIISNGTRLGFLWKAPGTTLVRSKGRSRLCKIEILLAYEGLLDTRQLKDKKTYWDYKHRPLSAYQTAKGLLRGIPKKAPGTGVWQQLGHVWSTFAPKGTIEDKQAPPFKGWLSACTKLVAGSFYYRIIDNYEDVIMLTINTTVWVLN